MNRKKGFTLVEVMISTAILVSVFGVLAYGISQCSRVRETARNSDIALNAAQEELEEIANSNLPDVETDFFTVPAPFTGLRAINNISGTDLYLVTVTVSWFQSGAEQMSRTVTTTFVQK